MKFYYNPLSTYSQKVLIACYEKGITFNPYIVDVLDPVELETYRKLYPLGKIPLLITDRDRLIPESSIIIEYLDMTFRTSAPLIPKNTEDARHVRFKDRMHDLYLNDPTVKILFEKMKPENEQNPTLINDSRLTLDIMYKFLNHELNNHTWCNGEDFTLADCAAAPALFYAQRVHPFSRYSSIKAYFSRIMGRPSFQKVIKEAEPFIKKFLN